jgi:hypothetical protein
MPTLDSGSLFLIATVAALVGEVASSLLELRARLRGRPSPPPFSALWTVRAVFILAGVSLFVAGAAVWDSLLIMAVGMGIALAGVVLGLLDKARRAFTEW